jgi:hypothetical protein
VPPKVGGEPRFGVHLLGQSPGLTRVLHEVARRGHLAGRW